MCKKPVMMGIYMVLSQQELEMEVFSRFLTNTGYVFRKIEQHNPPKPDIKCCRESECCYFELTDNTPHQTQKSIHAKKNHVRDAAYFIKPIPDTYKKKFTKKYEIESCHCYLVIYYTVHPVRELGGHFERELRIQEEWIRCHIAQSEFQKVWIYDYHQDRILSYIEVNT